MVTAQWKSSAHK